MKTSTPSRTEPAAGNAGRCHFNVRMYVRAHVRGGAPWWASIAVLLAFQIPGGRAASISLETAPPVVVKTVPVAGATDVDPGLGELRVTYSKPMQDRSWSWSTWGPEDFPEIVGDIRYLNDQRTCVLPVKLEPGKFYATWLNSEKFKNFKDRDGRSAVPYLLTFTTRSMGGGSLIADAAFRSEVEVILPSPAGAVAELLDLDTGQRATSETFGRNDRETHAWIRANQLDVLGVVEKGQIAVLCMDMVAVPAASNSWGRISAPDVTTNWNLAQGESKTVMGISPVTDMTDVWLFRTREGGQGVLQIQGPTADPDGVRVRYKLLANRAKRLPSEAAVREDAMQFTTAIQERDTNRPQALSAAAVEKLPAAGSDRSDQLLNADQQAVVAWTDRQFRSYFDDRTFDGWTEDEIRTLETKCIDALSGPRSRDYYSAINTLGALRSTNALHQLREIAFERVDGNNRNRWMAVRVLGIMGDRQSIPDLIPLLYHGNPNTHWWAQIALVQSTGQNFGGDWEAWGQWWNESGAQPPYSPAITRWWDGQADTVDGLKQTLDESDGKFLESIRSK